MPYYKLTVRNCGKPVDHLSGVTSDDDTQAIVFSRHVVWQLVHKGASRYVGWTLDIEEGNRAIGTIPFTREASYPQIESLLQQR